MDAKHRSAVEALLEKAANANDSAQAVNFAQAACNAANAMRVLVQIDLSEQPHSPVKSYPLD